AFVRQIGKVPVVVRDKPGFLVNRVLFPYLLDAAELFEAGVGGEKNDPALGGWGVAKGAVGFIGGIGGGIQDGYDATLAKAYGERDRACEILHRMRSTNMLGRKTGSGFYKYDGKQQSPNESITEWRKPASSRKDGNLDRRLMFLMVNEAARCIEEGVVETPEDADYGMILGTGFAPFRGGPLRFAEDFGLTKLVDEMNRLAQTEPKFAPCEILKKHAQAGTKFYES